ncbi:MAG: hypothetical protein LC107_11615 [Chitinophagales bacterium]|nr:hypothetical protein [Chitinophagales bacterium]
MDIVNFNKKLNKIAVLTGSLEGSSFSPLERDLLLTYIRDLYDIALGDEPIVAKKPEKRVVTAEIQTPVASEVTMSINKAEIVEPIRTSAAPMPEINIEKPQVAASIPEVKIEQKPAVVNPPAVTVVEQPAKAIPLVEKIKVAATEENLSQDQLLEKLFSEGQVQDLSDKLGLSPVQDLTKSMSINERIFNQHELFANNSEHFNEVLSKLNGLSSFEEAKQYLINSVIPQYGWTQDNKINKASTFIKLVKRKYL